MHTGTGYFLFNEVKQYYIKFNPERSRKWYFDFQLAAVGTLLAQLSNLNYHKYFSNDSNNFIQCQALLRLSKEDFKVKNYYYNKEKFKNKCNIIIFCFLLYVMNIYIFIRGMKDLFIYIS